MLEAALVFPLLLLVTLGVIRYGWMFLKAQQITNAARVGARIAIRVDATVADDVLPAISSLMTAAGMGDSDYQVTVTPEVIAGLEVGEVIEVRVAVPFQNIDIMSIPLFTALEPEIWYLGAAVAMGREGF
jgi:Flp pilus assembly protein TadG